MEPIKAEHKPDRVKEEFKEWLKKYCQDLKAKNKLLKSNLIVKQQRNNGLKAKIQQLSNNMILNSTAPTDKLVEVTQFVIANTMGELKAKSEQLENRKETFSDKFKKESKEIRKNFYELTTRDDITLKPFLEVEEAIKDLNKKIDSLNQQLKDEQKIYTANQQKREDEFVEINNIISILEPIEKETRFLIQDGNKCLADKLKTLNLQSIEEATLESSEAKELLYEINILKSQLNK